MAKKATLFGGSTKTAKPQRAEEPQKVSSKVPVGVIRIEVFNVYENRSVYADLDFAAPHQIYTSLGEKDFMVASERLLQLAASAAYLVGLAEAWVREQRKSALDVYDGPVSAKDLSTRQDAGYVRSSNAESVLAQYQRLINLTLELLRSNNANVREQQKIQ